MTISREKNDMAPESSKPSPAWCKGAIYYELTENQLSN